MVVHLPVLDSKIHQRPLGLGNGQGLADHHVLPLPISCPGTAFSRALLS
jgi:hypothetical protein